MAILFNSPLQRTYKLFQVCLGVPSTDKWVHNCEHVPLIKRWPSLPPFLENHLYGFQQLFYCLSPDETASRASNNSDNADQVDPGCLPSGMRSFLGHVHTYNTEAEHSSSQSQSSRLVHYSGSWGSSTSWICQLLISIVARAEEPLVASAVCQLPTWTCCCTIYNNNCCCRMHNGLA